MASSIVGLIQQDRDLNAQFNGASVGVKANLSKAPRKGRKPLGDLSNSVIAATPYKASQMQKSNIFSFTENDIRASGISQDATKKKNTLKTSQKVQKSTSRKALSDISNSSNHRLHEASKKKQTAKLSTVTEEQFSHCSIADQGFLHNHQECIKAQSKKTSMVEYLHILGLDNDISRQTADARTLSVSNHKSKSQPSYIELDEIDEFPMDEDKKKMAIIDSPPTKTPKPMNHQTEWYGNECSFELLQTPELRKY